MVVRLSRGIGRPGEGCKNLSGGYDSVEGAVDQSAEHKMEEGGAPPEALGSGMLERSLQQALGYPRQGWIVQIEEIVSPNWAEIV